MKNASMLYYNDIDISKFPLLKKGILNPADMFTDKELNKETLYKLNLLYSRDYKLSNDFKILFNNIRNLGR